MEAIRKVRRNGPAAVRTTGSEKDDERRTDPYPMAAEDVDFRPGIFFKGCGGRVRLAGRLV
jgi:hypothetical protein